MIVMNVSYYYEVFLLSKSSLVVDNELGPLLCSSSLCKGNKRDAQAKVWSLSVITHWTMSRYT